MQFQNIVLLIPEIFLSVFAMLILIWGAFFPRAQRSLVMASVAGLVVTCGLLLPLFWEGTLSWAQALGVAAPQNAGGWIQFPPVMGMASVDSMSVFLKLTILAAGIIVFLLSMDHEEFVTLPMSVFAFLLIISMVGMMLLVSAMDFLFAVIALELSGIPLFILIGFAVKKKSSTEGALKFFLVSTLSTGLLLMGLSYYYGYFGTTELVPLLIHASAHKPVDLGLGLILIFLIAGFGFKLAMVPFHMWAPDAYEAAPIPVTAFLSVAPKIAVLGFLLRVFYEHAELRLSPILAVFAVLTMTLGNIGALKQENIKRLMAYSSIAQIGYLLAALAAGGGLVGLGSQALLIYVFIYVFMNLGVFVGLVLVANQSGREDIGAFRGLGHRSLFLSILMVLFLLSLTGIPPMSGFVGKFAILAALMKAEGLLWLAIAVVVNSVISLYYYFRIVQEMFFKEAEPVSKSLQFSPPILLSLGLAFIGTVLLGIFPNSLVQWIRALLGA